MSDQPAATSGSIPQSSLLVEASPASLAELLNRDPLALLEQELDALVDYYRAQRERWKSQSDAQAPKAPRQPKVTEVATMKSQLSLDDLGI